MVREKAGGKGVNVILDMVGGSYIARNYEAAAPQARLVQIAFMEGSKVQIDFMRLMLKRLSHMGSTLRSRPKAEKAAIAASLVEKVWPLIEAGKVKPVMDQSFPLEKASEAHARMESSAHIGKIMLAVE